MTNFKDFQNKIREIGNVWNGENIYFSQMRDSYCAAYKPKYPNGCTEDMTIQTLENTGAYNRGNYELTIWKEGKYGCVYFDDIDEIKQYFNDSRFIQK